jgi:hypothetical protein
MSFISLHKHAVMLLLLGILAQSVTGEITATVGITGEDGDFKLNPVSITDYGTVLVPDDNPNIEVSARSLPGTVTNTTSSATDDSGGVSTAVIVVSVLVGVFFLAAVGFYIYSYLYKNNKIGASKPSQTVLPQHHPLPNIPGVPLPTGPQGVLTMCMQPGHARQGYYNKIIQLDLVHPMHPLHRGY